MNELLAEFLCAYTATNDWLAILPETLLALLALGLLLAEMVLPKNRQSLISSIAIGGQALILAIVLAGFRLASAEPLNLFSGMIVQTDSTDLMRCFFLISSILVCYLGRIYLSKQSLAKTEFYHLVIMIAAGMMLLVQSANFVMLFVALETVTVAFYVLVAYCRTNPLSLEAGLKYLILGALSSSILLFGIVLLYGAAGNPELAGASRDSLSYSELTHFVIMNSNNLIVRVGALLVIAGICFKIGAVPFQIWVPDVYQGAPTPVTAYLAIASKAAGFLVLIQLVRGPFVGLNDLLAPVLSYIAAITILFGNVAAVAQRNVKRLMGLSGVAHAGYLLMGVVASIYVPWAAHAVIFYLFTYLFASFVVFGVMSFATGSDDPNQELYHYGNFARRRPFLGGALAIGVGSLAGIPPLGGFIGKLFLFVAAYQAQLYGLLAISVVGVVISIYYYFGWIRECFFSSLSETNSPSDHTSTCAMDRILIGGLIVATVVIGLFPAALPVIP